MTDEQRYWISQSIDKLPEALRRDPSVDYTEGVFHITLNTRERYGLLGVIDTEKCVIDLTNIGEAVDKCWLQILEFYPNVELIERQVMPEHFHGLLRMCNTASQLPDIHNIATPLRAGWLVFCEARNDQLGHKGSCSTNGYASVHSPSGHPFCEFLV